MCIMDICKEIFVFSVKFEDEAVGSEESYYVLSFSQRRDIFHRIINLRFNLNSKVTSRNMKKMLDNTVFISTNK